MHFYTLGGHFEYLKVTEVTNLTYLLMYLESPFQYKSSIQKHPLIKTWSTFIQNLYFSPEKNQFPLVRKGLNSITWFLPWLSSPVSAHRKPIWPDLTSMYHRTKFLYHHSKMTHLRKDIVKGIIVCIKNKTYSLFIFWKYCHIWPYANSYKFVNGITVSITHVLVMVQRSHDPSLIQHFEDIICSTFYPTKIKKILWP